MECTYVDIDPYTNAYHSIWFGSRLVDGPSAKSIQNNELMKNVVASHNAGSAAVNTCAYRTFFTHYPDCIVNKSTFNYCRRSYKMFVKKLVFCFSWNVVCGHHVYKCIWTATGRGEELLVYLAGFHAEKRTGAPWNTPPPSIVPG